MLIEKWKRENNLFKFATKETSQDSFFSWVIHGINCNYPDRIENYNLAKEFLKEISPQGLKEEIDKIYEIKIIRQFLNIDILVILNMNNGKQKFLIIENKTSSGLEDSQIKTILYYTKLLDAFNKAEEDTINKIDNNNINTFNHWEMYYKDDVKDSIKDRIYSVLIRTNFNYIYDIEEDKNKIITSLNELDKKYEFLKNKNYFENHINFVNTPKKIENIIKIFNKYQHIDKLIEGYSKLLTFNLENENLLSCSENYVDYINNYGLIEEDETHFRTSYLCLACFNKILTNPIKINDKENIETRIHEREINIKLNYEINSNFNKIKVCTLDFNNGNDFKNQLFDSLWCYDDEKENKDLRYIYLFVKKVDEFNKQYYVFKGLFRRYKQTQNTNNTYTHVWKKCNHPLMRKNGKMLINKEDIEKYIEAIEKLESN